MTVWFLWVLPFCLIMWNKWQKRASFAPSTCFLCLRKAKLVGFQLLLHTCWSENNVDLLITKRLHMLCYWLGRLSTVCVCAFQTNRMACAVNLSVLVQNPKLRNLGIRMPGRYPKTLLRWWRNLERASLEKSGWVSRNDFYVQELTREEIAKERERTMIFTTLALQIKTTTRSL